MALKLFLLAGEASGDMHGAKLIEALKAAEPGATFVGMGGPKMAAAGLQIAKDLDGMQVVGFWEVAKHYGFFRTVFYELLDRVKQEKPDALVCIDYPGFNVRFAKEVAKLGIPCLYYIVPQVWAWKPHRAARIAEIFDRAFCVFEFEPPFFDRHLNGNPKRKMKTTFVGHPLLDQPKPPKVELPRDRSTIAMLPGSRKNEFIQLSGIMIRSFYKAYDGMFDGEAKLRALLSVHRGLPKSVLPRTQYSLEKGLGGRVDFRLEVGNLERPMILVGREQQSEICSPLLNQYESCSHASLLPSISDFSVVKSGTSTLEAALQGNPMCVVYRVGAINYAIARLLVNIPVFSLVNIVMGKYAVPELLQDEVNPQRIAAEIERGLTDRKYIDAQRAALAELPGKLGGPGASQRAAQGMLDFLRGRSGS
ncbi:MAG: hypothetical protein L6R28_14355 [Planctomycetes bacterium]|nr:hypothetical protein [Planctomycetota bacterium]